MPATLSPDWDRLNLLLLDYEHLPVALARMGLRFAAVLPCLRWWDVPGPVLLLVPTGPGLPPVYLDSSGLGGWRALENVHRGSDLASLGAWRWGCRYGQAAWRLARLCGMPALPMREAQRRGRW